MFICKQKITFVLLVFLEILQIYCKLFILGTLVKPGYTHPKYYHLVENFRIYLQAKEPLQPHVFLEILHRYANFLFWVLWACLDTHTQNGSINLQKILKFLCIPEINLIIHFFLEILHFKKSCGLIMGSSISTHNLRNRILPDM